MAGIASAAACNVGGAAAGVQAYGPADAAVSSLDAEPSSSPGQDAALIFSTGDDGAPNGTSAATSSPAPDDDAAPGVDAGADTAESSGEAGREAGADEDTDDGGRQKPEIRSTPAPEPPAV